MPRPGVTVKSRAVTPPRSAPTGTGPWFVAGLTAKGPTDRAVKIRNMGDYVTVFGPRVSYGLLYDALDAYFHFGGSEAWVTRVVGAAATVATIALPGAAGALALSADAIGQGTSTLQVAVVAGDAAGTIRLNVLDTAQGGALVEQSYDLPDTVSAVAWGNTSSYIRVRATGVVLPVVAAAAALAGGNDDRAAITDPIRIAALGLFLRNLGPGQVSYPGSTTPAIEAALQAHAQANNRFAVLDGVDTNADATLRAATAALVGGADPDGVITWSAFFGGWINIPGVVRNTVRAVPPSAAAAGLMAASDAGGNPNTPAAGPRGELDYALSLTQPEWSDAQRASLNSAGVNVFRTVYGGVRLYGYRTLGPEATSNWLSIGAARLRMAITAEAEAIGEAFMFAQLDGQGHRVAEFGGALNGMLMDFYARGALYGASPAEAFRVDVGSTVNTDATLNANELHAILSVRISPFAEAVIIEIVKTPITETL